MDKSRVFKPGDNLNAETVNWLNDTLLIGRPRPSISYNDFYYDINAQSADAIPPYGICVPNGHEKVKLYDGQKYPYMLVCNQAGCVANGWGKFSIATEPVPIWVDIQDNDVETKTINIAGSYTIAQYHYGPVSGSAKAVRNNPPFHVMGGIDLRGPNRTILAVQRFLSWEFGKTFDILSESNGDGNYDQRYIPLDLSDIVPGTYNLFASLFIRPKDLDSWTALTGEYGHIKFRLNNIPPDVTDVQYSYNRTQVGYASYGAVGGDGQQIHKVELPTSITYVTMVSLKPDDELMLITPDYTYPPLNYRYNINIQRVGMYDL